MNPDRNEQLPPQPDRYYHDAIRLVLAEKVNFGVCDQMVSNRGVTADIQSSWMKGDGVVQPPHAQLQSL